MSHPVPLAGALVALTCLTGLEPAAAETFNDPFADGKSQLAWQSHPLFDGGALEGQAVDDAPDGDGGIGVLKHEGGGLATISYAETERAEDTFSVQAWVDCPIEPAGRDGSLTGIAFFIQLAKEGQDPEKSGFYRLVCAYRAGIGALTLAYVGPNIGQLPLELERWELLEQAPPPSDSAWRKVRVEVELGLMEIYLDDVLLNQRPIPVEQVITDIANLNAGYAGVYAGHIGEEGTAEARVDGFVYDIP
ncbi:MAG: hypothetical protein R3349_03955 [Geminicoccaceae bacterium]|nr:hypothetical protein [Geminicoccaceae bacterium]